MRTAYVNEIWHGDKEVVRGFVVIEKTIDEAFETLFNEKDAHTIKAFLNHPQVIRDGGFHIATRFCQFVVFTNYDSRQVEISGKPVTIGFTIELLYFGTSDNPNDVFDYMLKLKQTGWREDSREAIVSIAREIKANQYDGTAFEIAELKIKDHFDNFSSYV